MTVKQADACSPDRSEFSAELGPEERARLAALLDHIHEYGTTAEGALRLAAELCQSARAAEREALIALAAAQGWHMDNSDTFEEAVKDICQMRAKA